VNLGWLSREETTTIKKHSNSTSCSCECWGDYFGIFVVEKGTQRVVEIQENQ